ncbi:MAG: lysophospholipid acyltransferase family protein [Burkholderiales bacterium]
MKALLRLLARLPLSWLHAAGALMGRLVYLLSPDYGARLRENLFLSRLWGTESEYRKLLRSAVRESGKAALELLVVWFRPMEKVRALVSCNESLDPIVRAEARQSGVIYLTPHLGCFEITGFWLSQRGPLTALYRPPKMRLLQPYIEAGRLRGNHRLAPTNLGGVRTLLKALKRKEAIMILPDQAPGSGEGAWAEFFGRQAYTMTLVGRLVEATGAPVVMIAAQRLPGGRGYTLHLSSVEQNLCGNEGPRNLNHAIESFVRRMPDQYVWSYNRYKIPAGVKPPDTSTPPRC